MRNVLTMFGRRLECLWPDTDLGSALRLFKQGKAHMALVRDVCTTVGTPNPFIYVFSYTVSPPYHHHPTDPPTH